ncbi:Uncharacterised protein [Mycobacteroides abscessus subsp. abscessus]|nr:Uncharacterised protein [Mycobacteroides abscessus subsp. abscessus]
MQQPSSGCEGGDGAQGREHQGVYALGRHQEEQPQQDLVQHYITGAVNGPAPRLPRNFLRRRRTRRLPSV